MNGLCARNLAAILLSAIAVSSVGAKPSDLYGPEEALLIIGDLQEAKNELEAALAADDGDDKARFALGIVQTLNGVEGLMQGLYRYGLEPRWQTNLPFVRLPVPSNPDPEPLTNDAFRKIISDFANDLARVEKTLALVKSNEVKLPLRLGMCRLDFNGDGEASGDESLWKIFDRLTRMDLKEETASQFVIVLDKGDVHWLRGYCRLLSAFCEIHLAHDTQNLHDRAAQFFFPAAKVRYPFAPRDEGR